MISKLELLRIVFFANTGPTSMGVFDRILRCAEPGRPEKAAKRVNTRVLSGASYGPKRVLEGCSGGHVLVKRKTLGESQKQVPEVAGGTTFYGGTPVEQCLS